MKKTIRALPLLAATTVSAHAAVVLTEDFGSSAVNPTATTFTAQNTWNYSDSTGTTVNTNESRLFNPGGLGSGETTHGWISALTTGNTFQQIQSNGTFTGLPTLGIGQQYMITLSWYGASQTSVTANDVNAYVNFTAGGNGLSFVSGANGTPGQPHFLSQTLGDGNAAADTVGLSFLAEGGSGGYDAGRSYTAVFTTTDDLNGDAFSLVLGRTTNTGGGAFMIYDNVTLDVSVVPEPGAALLGSFGLLALLRRRRA